MCRYRLTVEQRTRRQVLVYGQDEDTAKRNYELNLVEGPSCEVNLGSEITKIEEVKNYTVHIEKPRQSIMVDVWAKDEAEAAEIAKKRNQDMADGRIAVKLCNSDRPFVTVQMNGSNCVFIAENNGTLEIKR